MSKASLPGTERGSDLKKEESAAPSGLAMTDSMLTLSVFENRFG
jgi:hypothetical protein